ncbi:unnamed protein product [Gongylonema pulchrum]|uniref:Uncharacterized protein n=1 Tax=Gongylonema pulchrum TaxID=637853 RepID=A0A3P6QMA9_9BILA|nr:unnamed protein product [Gongylonema pulchrum]
MHGISKPTPEFAKVASRLLEELEHLKVQVITFKDGIASVKAFTENGSSLKEVAEILISEGVCEHIPSEKNVYSRNVMLSLRYRVPQ